MTAPLNWFIDFDETLATGSISWAFEWAFPKLIRKHRLPTDDALLAQAVLTAQERSSANYAPQVILHELFETMGWDPSLEAELFNDILTNYRPQLFDDALPFLTRLKALNRRVFVVSNNRLSLKFVKLLEIEEHITAIYTPEKYPGAQPKPHRSLWDCVLATETDVDERNSVVVGDDPWSDGAFADSCGLPCWIVDRAGRFSALYSQRPYRWVRSLQDIPLSD